MNKKSLLEYVFNESNMGQWISSLVVRKVTEKGLYFGAWQQQAITRANVGLNLWCLMASLGHKCVEWKLKQALWTFLKVNCWIPTQPISLDYDLFSQHI